MFNFLGIYKLLGNGVRIYLENQVAAFKTSKISEYCWIEIIKQKMKEIFKNLGCLWGGRRPVLQPHPLRNSAETAISAILTILGCLWGEVEQGVAIWVLSNTTITTQFFPGKILTNNMTSIQFFLQKLIHNVTSTIFFN